MPHYTPTSPAVSVLMVVMGAERSVRRAVESVQNQTLSNIQLVVVDAVGSGQVTRQLELIAERDLRVELVSAGGCARQEALDLALERSRGTYVAVVDADGWAAPKMLEELVGLADDRALELVVGGFTLALETAGGRTAELDVASEDEVFLTQHEFRAAAWRMFATGQLLPASAKLFRRDRAEGWGARFSAERESDHGFVISYLRDVERVGVSSKTLYHVSRSVAGRPEGGYRHLEEEHEALLGLYRHWGLEGDAASMETLQNRYIEQLVDCVEDICRVGSPVSSGEQRRQVERMLGTEHARFAASVARPRSSQARSMIAPIRAGNVTLVCVQARLLSLLRGARSLDVAPDAFV